MSPDILCSNAVKILPSASLYLFGVLTSNVHMSWARAIGGRLKSDYQYSANHDYNSFLWPNPTKQQKETIEITAQAILSARELYPEASMADMYGNLPLFPDLMKAHCDNDAAVLEAYGFPKDATESDIIARLFELYRDLTK